MCCIFTKSSGHDDDDDGDDYCAYHHDVCVLLLEFGKFGAADKLFIECSVINYLLTVCVSDSSHLGNGSVILFH